jgi:hypothetical protein
MSRFGMPGRRERVWELRIADDYGIRAGMRLDRRVRDSVLEGLTIATPWMT